MLRLVDPTNVADTASAGERTCVERISPVEGEGLEPSVPIKATTVLSRPLSIALALFPSARDQQFESLSLRQRGYLSSDRATRSRKLLSEVVGREA